MECLGYSSALGLLCGPKAIASMKTQVRKITEKHSIGLMNRYQQFPSMQEEKEEERTGVSIALKGMVLVRKGASSPSTEGRGR